jgi:hypothetical protein
MKKLVLTAFDTIYGVVSGKVGLRVVSTRSDGTIQKTLIRLQPGGLANSFYTCMKSKFENKQNRTRR